VFKAVTAGTVLHRGRKC